jgi:predicted secreted protein
MNQNARDRGAAESAAVTREVVDLLADAEIGMAQISCPEIACLGFNRTRQLGTSIREALETPRAARCCQQLAETTADRIQGCVDEGFEVLAVLGGNRESPGCAVHVDEAGDSGLAEQSGVFMRVLAGELKRRGIQLEFRGMRDADPELLRDDLEWLRGQIA